MGRGFFLLDPALIADRAMFDEPRRYPAGIAHVIVNGVRVIDNGTHTGTLPVASCEGLP
jgi:N-acyl-D-amino-acid deacylase